MATDHDGIVEKLKTAGYNPKRKHDKKIIDGVLACYTTLANMDLSSDEADIVLDLLGVHGRESLSKTQSFSQDSWMDFDYGNAKVGDYVRVREDAYDSGTGEEHNGLVGIIRYMSNRQVTVEYIGRAAGQSIRHPIDNLQSLKHTVK